MRKSLEAIILLHPKSREVASSRESSAYVPVELLCSAQYKVQGACFVTACVFYEGNKRL